MTRMFVSLLVAGAVAVPQLASAQSAPDRPLASRVEITLFPAGALFATEGGASGRPRRREFGPTVTA